jgi:DNA invertase Pin-like site-specific DNA recombinase
MQPNNYTVYGYVRVCSSNGVGDRKQSIVGQEEAIREWCKRKGFRLIETYKDIGVSGNISSRPGFIQLIYKTLSKPADFVVVTDYSRLSRERGFFFSFLQFLEHFGIELVALKNPRKKMFDYSKLIATLAKVSSQEQKK